MELGGFYLNFRFSPVEDYTLVESLYNYNGWVANRNVITVPCWEGDSLIQVDWMAMEPPYCAINLGRRFLMGAILPQKSGIAYLSMIKN